MASLCGFHSGEDDGLIDREPDVVHHAQTPPPQPQEPMEEDERGCSLITTMSLAILVVM